MLIKNLYKVTNFEFEQEKINAQIFINKSHEIFEGHFPNNPVMPGVCMMQIIKELTEKALNKKLFMQKANNIKFMDLINPQVNPILDLVIDITENQGSVKVKNVSKFGETIALKYNGVCKIIF